MKVILVQPIIVIAIVGATVAMSVGYLTNPYDMTMIQTLGFGETDLQSPIVSAMVQVRVDITGPSMDNSKFRIVECVFKAEKDLAIGTMLFCKLLDENGSVLAEGMIMLVSLLSAGDTVSVPIDFLLCPNCNDIDDVHDIIFLVKGESTENLD